MAGIGRKIGPASTNNQIKNMEVQQSNVPIQPVPIQQDQPSQVNTTQIVQDAISQQKQQTQTQQNQQNAILTSIFNQIKTITNLISQNKNKESSNDYIKDISKIAINIDDKLSRISTILSVNASQEINKNDLTSFINSIGAYTNKLSSVNFKSPTNNISGIETNSEIGKTSLEYNTVMDLSKLENAFNNFANKLESIINRDTREAELSEALANTDSVESVTLEHTNNQILTSIREQLINLNQSLTVLQQDYSNISAKTTAFYAKNAEEFKKQEKRADNEILRSQDRQDKLLSSLNNNKSKIDETINENSGPKSRLDEALDKLRKAYAENKDAEKSRMSDDANANNNLVKYLDKWATNKLKASINTISLGHVAKALVKKSARKKVKSAIIEGRQAEAELKAINSNESESDESESNEPELNVVQEKTTMPDRPNKDLATPNKLYDSTDSTGIIAPSNNALSKAQNNTMNSIMLRNSAIDEFAESKDAKRSGISAEEMKKNDPILAKLEAQLVQLTLIRAAIIEQTSLNKKAEREKELQEALSEGAIDEDSSNQLIPIEKETVIENKSDENDDKKGGGGLLSILLMGLGTILLGGGGFLTRIISWITSNGLPLLGDLLKLTLSGLWKLISEGAPALFKLLWEAGSGLFKLISGPIGSLLKFIGGKAWNFIKSGAGKLMGFLKGPLLKGASGLLKGGGKLAGSLLAKAAPILGPVGAAAGVALIGWQVGKMLGNWLKMDEKMNALFGNTKAEKSNEEHAAALKEQADAQNKNRAIATASWEDQVGSIKNKQLQGKKLSAVEQTIIKNSSDLEVATRGDRHDVIMGAVKDAGENLTTDDVNAAMEFLNTGLTQLDEEIKSTSDMAQEQFDEIVKNTEFDETKIFENEEFKQLLKSDKIEDCDKAIKMLQDENRRLFAKQQDAFWSWTKNSIQVEIDKILVMTNALLKKKNALKEKEKFENSKKELEELQKTAKKFDEPSKSSTNSPPPDLSTPEFKSPKKQPSVEISGVTADNTLQTNITKDLIPNKTDIDASFNNVDASIKDEIKQLYDSLTINGINANDNEFGQFLKSYIANGIKYEKESYGIVWDDKLMYKSFFIEFRDKWLKNFYENNQILYFENDGKSKSIDKSKISMQLKPSAANLFSDDSEQLEMTPITINNSDNYSIFTDKDELTNIQKMDLNEIRQTQYNKDLASYKSDKNKYKERLKNLSIDNDENLKYAYESYVSTIAADESLGGTVETRTEEADKNWHEKFKKNVVLYNAGNGIEEMTKFEFYDRYYEKPKLPEPPVLYELDKTDQETGEVNDLEKIGNEQESNQLEVNNIESGENNNSAKNAIATMKEINMKNTVSQQKQAVATAKMTAVTAQAVQQLGNNVNALVNPASSSSINAAVQTVAKSNINKETLVYPPSRAGGIMVNVEG